MTTAPDLERRKPVISVVSVHKILISIATAVAASVAVFLVNSVFEIESNGKLLLDKFEVITTWQKEVETDMTDIKNEVDSKARITTMRVDHIYGLILEKTIGPPRYDPD